jgi:3-methyladenine DNA glycosylase AlkC
MRAQYELTKRFTAEFSIRAFLEADPVATLERLEEWATDPNVHVRRLVSEGTRPRLPWAPRLPRFVEDPQPVLRLLEMLKDDPELYVRRSVANNLNDIAKDHPDLVVEVCARWSLQASPERRWLIRHGLRTLVKQGHEGALAVLGYGRGSPAETALGVGSDVVVHRWQAVHRHLDHQPDRRGTGDRSRLPRPLREGERRQFSEGVQGSGAGSRWR